MADKKLYAFNRERAGILARIANSYNLNPHSSTQSGSGQPLSNNVGAWIMQATTEITAADYTDGTSFNSNPGDGYAKLKYLANGTSGTLEDFLSTANTVVEKQIFSLLRVPIPVDSIILVMRTQDETLWVAEWLDRRLGSYVAKTGGTAISARSGTTPGEGYVDLYRLNLDVGSTGYGELEVYEADVHVYSWVSVESGTNSWCYVGYDVFGTLWFENEDCGALYA